MSCSLNYSTSNKINKNESQLLKHSNKEPDKHHSSKIYVSRQKNSILSTSKEDNLKKICNQARTNLLLMASKELNEIKKTRFSKINNKTISDAEKEFSAQNTHTVQLKMEVYSPRGGTHRGEAYQKKMGNKLLSNDLSSPGEMFSISSGAMSPKSRVSVSPMKELDNSGVSSLQLDDVECEEKSSFPLKLTRKTSISFKKMEYFRMSTLNKFKSEKGIDEEIEENEEKEEKDYDSLHVNLCIPPNVDDKLELINVESGFLKNKNTMKRTENGFKYLRTLARKIKKRKKKNKVRIDSNFEVMKEILFLKENLEYEEQQKDKNEEIEGNNKNNYNNSNSNLNSKKNLTIPNLVLIPAIDTTYEHKTQCYKVKTERDSHSENKNKFQNSTKNKLHLDIVNYPKHMKNESLNFKNEGKRSNRDKCLSPIKKEDEKLNNSFNLYYNSEPTDFIIKLYECSNKKISNSDKDKNLICSKH